MKFTIETNSKLLNFVRVLVMQYFSKDTFCTVIYHDQTLNCRQSELFGAVNQAISYGQLPVIRITTGTGMEQAHLELAIELGCQVLCSTKLYQENSFNVEKSSFTSNVSLFYDKLSNLGGRSIRTGIVDYVPYATTEYVGANRGNVDAVNSTLSKELHTEGFEGTLIVEFCKFYNCNLKVWPFVLSNSYAGGLASVLTVPRYGKSLETIHDFAQSPYRWGVPAIAWILAIVDAESVWIPQYLNKPNQTHPNFLQVDLKAVVKKFDVIPDEGKLYQRTLAGDFGIGIELLNSQKITVGPYIREDNVHLLELPKQMLYYSYTTVAAQRGWPVMEQLNHFILLANQHGLVLHWERRALRKNQSTRMEVALDPTLSRRQQDEVVQALTVEHIFGPIFILFVGAAFATGIFVLEIMWHSVCLGLESLKKYRK
ncbi:conserved hypothetical protein [Culex quinquefasciatus]|uniref:Ionotropic glutamate receptor L-glutamate and glycine-binding domain-containing protein n=1 Tax=Culex quinquefasciatus TaxID=7176 RepID=B0XI34_CULQU|nr:conserved hypothetical protein [Culex quinquefasciatus]|eukprot:XP_001869306.1 conserved hypothetical protein [Culex quinquefasciatus]